MHSTTCTSLNAYNTKSVLEGEQHLKQRFLIAFELVQLCFVVALNSSKVNMQ